MDGKRVRKRTDKGVEFWVAENERNLRQVRRELDDAEGRVFLGVSECDKERLPTDIKELKELYEEFLYLCDKLLSDVGPERVAEIRELQKVLGKSVKETVESGLLSLERKVEMESRKSSVAQSASGSRKMSSRKSSRISPKKHGSGKASSVGSSSSLGLLRMKMVEAEIEMEDLALAREMRKAEGQQLKKKAELASEELIMKSEWDAVRAKKKLEIYRKHIEEQELGSDDPGDDFEENEGNLCTENDRLENFLTPREELVDEEKHSETVRKPVPDWKSDRTLKMPKIVEEATVKPENPRNLNTSAQEFVPRTTTKISECEREEEKSAGVLELLLEQSAPEIDIEKFSGNALDFRLFMTNFETQVERKVKGDSGRLARLIALTKGTEAHDMIEPFVYCPGNGYVEAKKKLIKEYGNESKISVAYQKRIRDWPQVGGGESFRKFYLFLNKVQWSVDSEDYRLELNGTENLNRLASKLPVFAQHGWRRKATGIYEDQGRKPNFQDFLSFVERESRVANNPAFVVETGRESGGFGRGNSNPPQGGRGRSGSGRGFARGAATKGFQGSGDRPDAGIGPGGRFSCEFCGMMNHEIERCYAFRKQSIDERIKFIKGKGLCFGCLKRVNHIVKDCKNRLSCTICEGRHATPLHRETSERDQNNNEESSKDKESIESKIRTEGGDISKTAATRSEEKTVAMSCVLAEGVSDVTGNTERGYFFLDSLSNTSFITSDYLGKLVPGAETKCEKMDLSTLQGTAAKTLSSVTGISVRSLDGEVEIKLPKLFVIDKLPFDGGDIMDRRVVEKWPHLRHLVDEIPGYDPSVPIGLLLGNDAPRLLEPHEVARPDDSNGREYRDAPYAIRFLLGWSGIGPNVEMSRKLKVLNTKVKSVTSTGAVVFEEGTVKDDEVKDIFEQMYSEDFIEKKGGDKRSQEDFAFLDLLETETRFKDGHYEMPLPLRESNLIVPDNREEALKEAYRFRSRLNRDTEEKRKVVEFMVNMETKGFSERVPESQLKFKDGRRFYITYHSVKNAKKPEKTRVVYNCARKSSVEKISLNDMLMSGPDLCNKLVGVAARWREEEESFVADIKEMFYQNRVPPEQRHLLRYFWWDNEQLLGQPVEYQMCVHIFGATSSPACANFALKKCADDFEEEFPMETSECLRRNFYVDDLCKSCPDVESAKTLACDVRKMCARGGYNLTKFLASDPEILSGIPEENRLEAKESETERIERVLGMKWIISNDELGFEITVRSDRPGTKRGLLSSLHAVNYDPLGLTSPFLLEGKLVMQAVSALKIGWDSPVDQEYLDRFKDWLESLVKLETCRLPRCYKPKGFGKPVKVELHACSDACEYGYGAGLYLRLVNEEGEIAVSLVAGKSRVMPLSGTTIPRAELEAAKLAAELVALMTKELTYSNLETFCWTDSLIVLAYFRNRLKKFKTFVANRVRDVKTLVGLDVWDHIKSEDNPADDASRGLDASKITDLSNHRWFKGPQLLQQADPWNEDSESEPVMLPDISEDKETKVERKTAQTKLHGPSDDDDTYWIRVVENQSDWKRMKFRVASLIGLVINFQNELIQPVDVTVELLEKAEVQLLKKVQSEGFGKEIETLLGKVDVSLPKESALKNLNPYVDENGLLRQEGRIKNSDIPYELRNPIILPKFGHIVDSIIRDCHLKAGHGGRGFTMNEIRSRGYHIIHLNARVRSVINKCVVCRRHRRDFGQQQMADLPDDRAAQAPPMTYIGMDVFGHYFTKDGRKEHKRYVVLFTDLVYRGIHVEMLNSLETDSFLNAFTRFTNRRGNIRLLRSDNATNFVGAKNEIQNALKEIEPELKKALVEKGCDIDFEWKFNIPTASNQGGVFERQIGTTRNVLNSILSSNPGILTDESFRTLLTEAEAVVNCRPLTVETLSDGGSFLPISPSSLLTQKSKVILPIIGQFDDKSNLVSRKQWKRVKHLANEFWVRFRKEFLAQINQRRKWQNVERNFRVGDIVIMKDDSLHRNDWPMAKVVQVYPDDKGLVRNVQVRKSRYDLKGNVKVFDRPINKLVLLFEAEPEITK